MRGRPKSPKRPRSVPSRGQGHETRGQESQGHEEDERPRSSPNVQYYKERLPRRGQGSHVRMHRALSPSLQRHDTQLSHQAYGPCMNILHKQRASSRNFAAQVPHSARYVRMVTERLYTQYDVRFKPAESRGREPVSVDYYTLTTKPIYTAEEVKEIIQRIQQSSKGDKHGGQSRRIPSRRGYYPADLVCEIIKDHTAPVTPPSRPKSCRARIVAPVPAEIARDVKSCEKRQDADETTKRISQYDRRYGPAESKGQRASTPPPHPEQQHGVGRDKMSEQQIDHVVQRLNRYDNRIWPPESKGCRQRMEEHK